MHQSVQLVCQVTGLQLKSADVKTWQNWGASFRHAARALHGLLVPFSCCCCCLDVSVRSLGEESLRPVRSTATAARADGTRTRNVTGTFLAAPPA